MSWQVRLTSVEYAVLIHATEDLSKVIKAVENLMPPKLRERKNVEIEEAYGHYENPIRILKASFRNPEYASQVFAWVWRLLPNEDKVSIIRDLDLYVNDKLKLYMRLDKQDAFSGLARLSFSDDVIKVIFNFKGSKEALRDFLLGHDPEGV